MKEYIIINSAVSPESDLLLTTLAKAGWLVGAATSADGLRQQIGRYGPPAMVIYHADQLQPADHAVFDELKRRGNTRFLSILAPDVESVGQGDGWARGDDALSQPVTETDLISRVHRLLSKPRPTATGEVAGYTGRREKPANLVIDLKAHRAADYEWLYELSPIEQKILRAVETPQSSNAAESHVAYTVTVDAARPKTYVVCLACRLLPA
jgi:hypothetical protein